MPQAALRNDILDNSTETKFMFNTLCTYFG